MRRRDVIAIAGAAVAWPLKVYAHHAPGGRVFVFGSRPIDLEDALKQGLKEKGFVEGQNLSIEYRWANGLLSQHSPPRRNSDRVCVGRRSGTRRA